ncbi:MAG TPA: NAD(+) synthase [Flavobacteriales bacterium]|nr:NAD(+) synthase [Flavobacteriales bacterium]HRE74973.1 NAD(+) synthase [Flavobacteriales bacterium]HRE95403.1 NAD(+) synthase [Flavobacteriales bacterium]HRJ36048.1 NAD(+) synthase [Flavobacteriales bacterium]HRJ38085.1 NAD(+) synthase [Flavobacteriales bacterium]
MQHSRVILHISNWLKDYSNLSNTNGFVVGISGGIDSAVTSVLCALSGKKVVLVNMPIHQREQEYSRAKNHIENLCQRFSNVSYCEVSLTDAFEQLRKSMPDPTSGHFLAMANTRARLRMTTLYAIGQTEGLLVAGTGNKIEDFGIGFYTKYGDGGVDLSPIADLTKTQVFALAKELEVIAEIRNAKPTDGLWEDGRSDEDQIGATYPELEWAMEYVNRFSGSSVNRIDPEFVPKNGLDDHQQKVLAIYIRLHNANKHKMLPIPVCEIPQELF